MSVIASYRDLKVWQSAMDMVQGVYLITEQFPNSETYGLSSQMRRAAISVPSNIAEGHARDSTKEYLRFISVAMGSLAELETQFLLSERLNYLEAGVLNKFLEQASEIGRMLRSLQRALKAKLKPQSPAPSP